MSRPTKTTQSYKLFEQLFLLPIFEKHFKGYEKKSVYEYLFATEVRHIKSYKALHSFLVPGLLVSGNIKIQGIGYRKITKGSEVTVRTDARTPDVIDVEFSGGIGNLDHVYCLNMSEWNSIAAHLFCLDESH